MKALSRHQVLSTTWDPVTVYIRGHTEGSIYIYIHIYIYNIYIYIYIIMLQIVYKGAVPKVQPLNGTRVSFHVFWGSLSGLRRSTEGPGLRPKAGDSKHFIPMAPA